VLTRQFPGTAGIHKKSMNNHYGTDYFRYQRSIGEFGGEMNATKFSPFITSSDAVLDFGCGGGFILRNLDCKQRYGIEINPAARAEAQRNGIRVFSSINEVPETLVNVLKSHHALEHVGNPLASLSELRRTLVPGGRALFIVPCESILRAYRPNDINQHLYTWSPMCFGNLLAVAGYTVDRVEPLFSRWPPGIGAIRKIAGIRACRVAAKVWGHLAPSLSQVRASARFKSRRVSGAKRL
jgi:SAM-dependent methyltransferase